MIDRHPIVPLSIHCCHLLWCSMIWLLNLRGSKHPKWKELPFFLLSDAPIWIDCWARFFPCNSLYLKSRFLIQEETFFLQISLAFHIYIYGCRCRLETMKHSGVLWSAFIHTCLFENSRTYHYRYCYRYGKYSNKMPFLVLPVYKLTDGLYDIGYIDIIGHPGWFGFEVSPRTKPLSKLPALVLNFFFYSLYILERYLRSLK